MICKKCGNNNRSDMQYCAYCRAPLYNIKQGNQKNINNQKRNETIIVVLIIVLVLALLTIAGVYIYKVNKPKVGAFHGGGGGGSMSSYSSQCAASTPAVSQVPTVAPTIAPTVEQVQAPQSNANNSYDEQNMIKQDFMSRASRIEEHYDSFLYGTMTQSELNRESAVIYGQWDTLLNDIYLYLKSVLPESSFNTLQQDELEWIELKENAIEEEALEYEGGSMEPMVRNMTGIEYTSDRCYYLISLIDD